jgi:hypothetical protein
VGEISQPTDGNKHASNVLAQQFYAGLMKQLVTNLATVVRPSQCIEMYLFAPDDFECHWAAIFKYAKPVQQCTVVVVTARMVWQQGQTSVPCRIYKTHRGAETACHWFHGFLNRENRSIYSSKFKK